MPFNLGELRDPLVAGRVTLHFVHLWDPEERVYDARRRQESYRPSPASRSVLDRVAREIGGASTRSGGSGLRSTPPRRLGSGPVAARGRELQAVPLAPYAAVAAVFPRARPAPPQLLAEVVVYS